MPGRQNGVTKEALSRLPGGSKPWPMQAGWFVSNTGHDQVRDRLPFVFEDLSSSRSSICSAGCGTTGALSLRAPPRTRQRRLCRCCRSRNSRRSRCCRLPIINGDPEQAYFRRRHGRVDHHRALPYPLAVRDSPQFGFTYKGRAVDVKQIGRELGVRYVLEGLGAEGRAAGAHHRPADRRGNGNLWADRFDGSLEDVFELQERSRSASPV